MVTIGGRAHNIEQVHEVGKLGYRFAEISLLDPEEVESQLDDLVKLKEMYGMFYLAHYPNENNPSDTEILEEMFMPKLRDLLDLSKELGIRKGTMHFWMDKRWAPSSLISAKIEMLSDLVSYAKKMEIVLCIENLTEQHDSFSLAFDAIPDLMMTMDIGHGELLSSENTSFGFIQHVFNKIEHMHVHDNHGGKGVEDDLHLALGEGRVDYPKIFSLLKEKGYDSTITMEVKLPDMPKTRSAIERYIIE